MKILANAVLLLLVVGFAVCFWLLVAEGLAKMGIGHIPKKNDKGELDE